MKRASYQQGSVICKPRKRGPDVWVFRYMDDGIQKSLPIGTTVKFKTKASARKEADKLLTAINERTAGVTMAGLCDRFNLECEKGGYLRPHSVQTYKSFAKRVRIDLGVWRVDELVKDIETIEKWVNEFKTLRTPDRVIPNHLAKGKLIPGKTIPGRPAASCQQENEVARQGVPAPALRICDEVEDHPDAA
jgi:hypothetical protein